MLDQRQDPSDRLVDFLRHGMHRMRQFAAVLHEVQTVLAEAGVGACDDGQLLIRRVVAAKSGCAYVNSTPVTLAVLRRRRCSPHNQ